MNLEREHGALFQDLREDCLVRGFVYAHHAHTELDDIVELPAQSQRRIVNIDHRVDVDAGYVPCVVELQAEIKSRRSVEPRTTSHAA